MYNVQVLSPYAELYVFTGLAMVAVWAGPLAHRCVAGVVCCPPRSRRCWEFSLLENVSYTPKSFEDAVAKEMGGPPLTVYGGSFGWVRRTQCFWGKVAGRTLHGAQSFKLPKHINVTRDPGDNQHAVWAGKKPLPASIFLESGFRAVFHPEEIISQGANADLFLCSRGASATQGIAHRVSQLLHLSAWSPPFTYEDKCLLWKGSSWRQPNSRERAAAMMIPVSILEAAATAQHTPAQQREAVRASLVGNSSHLSAIMLALVCLLQLLPEPQGVPLPAYAGMEQRLRAKAQGTAWGDMHDRCPDSCFIPLQQLEAGIHKSFGSLGITLPHFKATPEFELALLQRLQVARVAAWLTGDHVVLGPPE